MDFHNCIFKYLDIYDAHFMENLRNDELVTKYFDDFNDPYDSHYGVDTIWPHLEKEKDKIKNLIKNLEPQDHQEITKSNDSIIQYINSNVHLNEYTYEQISNGLSKFRVCCFSRRWNQILMWAHYANGCRGLVLIFDKDKIPMGSKSRLLKSDNELTGTTGPIKKVHYNILPPVINAVEVFEAVRIGTEEALEKITSKMLKACVLTKYKKWSYEKESRLIAVYDDSIDRERVLYKYRRDALKGAIIGHKSDPQKITEIAKSMPNDSTIYFADADNDRYKLKINRWIPAKDIASGKARLGKAAK